MKKIRINWSIQNINKIITKGRMGSSENYYISGKKDGRKTIRKVHKTLGEALKEVGI